MDLHYGIVEDIYDPKRLGRVKVRVVNVHSADKNLIPTKSLPWAIVMAGTTTPGISGLGHSAFLVQGAWVVGTFTDVDLQSFMVMGSLPSMSGPEFKPSSFGFTDPNGEYPRNTNEEDNNLRARGNPDPNDYEVQGTYQPRSAYAPQYPHNHVYESESGHIKEYDDTPGATRIRERHNSGTYYEVQPGGSKIERVVADNYELILGDDTIEVKGNVNIIVSEDVNLSCAGNVTANVGKNVDFLVNGDVNGEVRGNIAMRVGARGDTTVGYTYEEVLNIWKPADWDLYQPGGYLEFEQGPEWHPEEVIQVGAMWTYKDQSLPARNGHVDIHTEGNVTAVVDGSASITVHETTTLDCPDTHITGELRVDGNISCGKDVYTDAVVSLNNHTHPGDGGGGLAAHAAATGSPNAT